MEKIGLILTLALSIQAAISAQPQKDIVQQLVVQQAGTLGAPSGVTIGPSGIRITITPDLRREPGKPFSATVTDATSQTFLDGTHVVRVTTTVEYRDAEGRTRIERSVAGGNKTIIIRDPVEGVNYELDPSSKSGFKTVMAEPPAGGGRRGPATDGTGAVAPGARGGRGRGGAMFDPNSGAPVPNAKSDPNTLIEDLGTTNINGVDARGTRVTTTVPVGAIGNDREFHSVSERWFSPDLNLLVKSVSTDPRFGTTTYELTNINRGQPDPSLFRPPADYSIR